MPDERRLSLRRLIVEGVITGVCCVLLSLTVRALVFFARPLGPLRVQVTDSPVIVTTSVTARPTPEPINILTSGLLSPILETVLFLLLFWAWQRTQDLKLRTIPYIFTMGALGFLGHGASYSSINRALPFALLAALFVRWAKIQDVRSAFAVTALAHIVWNQSVLIIYFARNGWG